MIALRAMPMVLALISASGAGEPWPRHTIDSSSRGADGVKLLDFNGDGLEDVVVGWEEGGLTRLCLHPGVQRVRAPWPAVTVGPAPNVEDATPVDLDGNGTADVVSCCEGRTRTVFVHWGPEDEEQLLTPTAWTTEPLPESVNRMAWMFCVPMQVDGRRGVDLVAAGKGPGAEIGWFESPGDPRDLAAWKWHPLGPVGWVMSIQCRDLDGDGDRDILYSDRRGSQRGIHWFENPSAAATAWPRRTVGGADREVMFLAVGDLDGDGTDDVTCAVKSKPILFLQGKTPGLAWRAHEITMPQGFGGGKGVAVGDLDGDGRSEVVFSCESAVGERSGVGRLVFDGFPTGDAYMVDNVGGPEGIKFDRLELRDVDRDGDLDVLCCEERESMGDRLGGLGVFWYENRQRRTLETVR